MAELTREAYRRAHHYFVSGVVAKSQVLDEAQRRALDTRSPEDSVVHYHVYNDNGCPKDCRPDEYEAGKGFLKEVEQSG
jgi:hypothetical protein